MLRHAETVLTDPGARAEVAAVLAGLLLYGGSIIQALQALEPVLGDPDADTRSTVQALVVAVPALFHAGRCEQAITAAHRAFESEQRLGEEVVPFGHLQIAVNLGNAYLAAGRVNDADALATKNYDLAIEHTRAIPCREGALGLQPGTNRPGPRSGPHRAPLAAGGGHSRGCGDPAAVHAADTG